MLPLSPVTLGFPCPQPARQRSGRAAQVHHKKAKACEVIDHDHEPRHVYRSSPLFERRGDRFVARGIRQDSPYERIFRLKLWLAGSLLANVALALVLYLR